VWNTFRHDGDRDWLLELLPVVERILRWYTGYIDERGTLADVPEWNLIDWSSVFVGGRSSLITGLWARGLAEYAEMAEWLGNRASATASSATPSTGGRSTHPESQTVPLSVRHTTRATAGRSPLRSERSRQERRGWATSSPRGSRRCAVRRS
jgi:hypothetical protein